MDNRLLNIPGTPCIFCSMYLLQPGLLLDAAASARDVLSKNAGHLWEACEMPWPPDDARDNLGARGALGEGRKRMPGTNR